MKNRRKTVVHHLSGFSGSADGRISHNAPGSSGYREDIDRFDALAGDYVAGRISRRGFLSTTVALGLSFAAASSFVSRVEASTPKRGGRLRMGVTGGATTDVLDPGQILDTYMMNVLFGQVRNSLTEIAPDGSLRGELAESWDSSDGKTWNFKIRQGVEFHNGKSLVVEDVVDSIRHHMGADNKSAANGLLTGISEVTADGKDLRVVLDGANADFPFILSDYHINICPSNGDGTIDWGSGTGTGGYSIVEHEPGVRTLTKRNPNYWRPDSAWFDEVETLQIADATARTNGLTTDALDLINNVEVKTIDLLKRVKGVHIKSTTGNKQVTLPMRCDTAPFDNPDVRNAIKLSVDREQWLRVIARGYGELGNDNPIGPANQFRASADDLPQRSYDPEKARHLLKKAGLDNLKIQFHAADTGFTGAVDAGLLMRETALAAGIDIEVVREPDDGYWSNVWMVKPFSACYWGGRPTEDWMFSQIYAADASWNDTFWKNTRFNELLLMGRSELDEAKRRDIYVEMQQLVHTDGGVCLPMFLSDILAHNDKLATPAVLANNWELDGQKCAERWWFS